MYRKNSIYPVGDYCINKFVGGTTKYGSFFGLILIPSGPRFKLLVPIGSSQLSERRRYYYTKPKKNQYLETGFAFNKLWFRITVYSDQDNPKKGKKSKKYCFEELSGGLEAVFLGLNKKYTALFNKNLFKLFKVYPRFWHKNLDLDRIWIQQSLNPYVAKCTGLGLKFSKSGS
jgi:hypothetical protein